MKVALGIFFAIFNIIGLSAFIIPREIPTILSVIYSFIPTLRKGTDSRIGWGYRLGDRADFQVLMELGPQTHTQPLGNQIGRDANKRNALDNLANSLYAQKQQEEKEKLQTDKVIHDDSILEEIEKRKLRAKKSQELVNNTSGKTNRNLISILTEEDKAISELKTSEKKNKRPLDDASPE